MVWKGFNPVVHHISQVYEKGITVGADTLATYRVDWHPSPTLPKWAITIGWWVLIYVHSPKLIPDKKIIQRSNNTKESFWVVILLPKYRAWKHVLQSQFKKVVFRVITVILFCRNCQDPPTAWHSLRIVLPVAQVISWQEIDYASPNNVMFWSSHDCYSNFDSIEVQPRSLRLSN